MAQSSAWKQLALLSYVHKLIPREAAVFLVGDCEFGFVEVLSQLERWHWFYVLRQKGDTLVWIDEKTGFQPFASYAQKPGQSIWLGNGYLTAKEIHPVSLLVHWGGGEKEPWCLATNLPNLKMALQFYQRRMWKKCLAIWKKTWLRPGEYNVPSF